MQRIFITSNFFVFKLLTGSYHEIFHSFQEPRKTVFKVNVC